MSTARETLSLGMTFRNPAEIAEVEELRKKLQNTTWTTSSIYLVGLRAVTKKSLDKYRKKDETIPETF